MNPNYLTVVNQHLLAGRHLWLVLDYDGTLVPIAATPEQALPDSDLLVLLASLAENPQVCVTILSGRSLVSLSDMLPLSNLVLAGTYGLEIRWPNGRVTQRVRPEEVRPTIQRILSAWAILVASQPGFLIEDKGIAVALHARFAEPYDAEEVMSKASAAAHQILDPIRFRLLGGDRFVEAAPSIAHKDQTVDWLRAELHTEESFLVYVGDDDKDAEAFATVKRYGGIPIQVGFRNLQTQAYARLPSPASVREWLYMLRVTLATSQARKIGVPHPSTVRETGATGPNVRSTHTPGGTAETK